MNWEKHITDFEVYLSLEKRLSKNTTVGYVHDIKVFAEYMQEQYQCTPNQVLSQHIESFLATLLDRKLSKTSQARMLSSLRSFYKFMLLNKHIETMPTEFIDNPKIGRKLPEVLSAKEIDDIINAIDLSDKFGHRNQAIVETLYGCGLRVSELTTLRLSDLFFNDGFIRVIGKGNKQRLVPIGEGAIKSIELYISCRKLLKYSPKSGDILFLNNNGHPLTRVMIFYIVRDAAIRAGITKHISPHTFRHSFATHLLEGGVDIRQVQEMLGHESIITTEIYTHLDRKHLRDTLAKFHPLGENN
ncbi:MAG: site-specific tyrosine recombinase XerD [Rikenellaceae bacterium]